MKKEDILKIFVIAAAVVLSANLLSPYFLGRGSGDSTVSGDVTEGIASFNGTIRTYDPFIAVPASTNTSVLDSVKTMDGYKAISFFSDSVLINTTTRDDVYPLASYLREQGVEVYGIANVAFPSPAEVQLANGSTVEAPAAFSIVRVPMPVLFQADSYVSISMIVGLSEGQIYGYSNPVLLSEEKSIIHEGTVVSMDSMKYTCTIPWKNRTQVDVLEFSDGGNASYEQRNSVVFSESLSSSEIIEKKLLSYVSYIDQYSVDVSANFTDMERLVSDFPGKQPVFSNSTLVVEAAEPVDIGWDCELVYSYTVLLSDSEEAEFDSENVSLETAGNLQENDSVLMNVSGVVMGNRFVRIDGVKTA